MRQEPIEHPVSAEGQVLDDIDAVPSRDEDRAVLRGRSARLRAQSVALQQQAETAVARARQLESENDQLREGLASRGRIEHVVGMLMLMLSCDADTAWEALVHISSLTNRKVRDLADLVATQVAQGGGLPADVASVLQDVLGPTPTAAPGRPLRD